MNRSSFLQSLTLFSMAPLTGTAPSPQPSATPGKWDTCIDGGLPYDKPLELKMRVLDGPDFDLMKYRGRPVFINIFATWCEPCAAEMPLVVFAAAKHANDNLAVIGVNVRESDNAVRAYRKKFEIPFPIAMDEQGGLAYQLENGETRGERTMFPVSLFIRPDGFLYCVVKGSMGPRQFGYRMEKFIKDCTALTTPQPNIGSHRLTQTTNGKSCSRRNVGIDAYDLNVDRLRTTS